jgi:glucose-6-phosphate 1-dehydrogenase
MEQPSSFSKEGVRDARAKAIRAIRPIDPQSVPEYVVRGQYEGYKDESNISPESQTETYSAMKLFVDTPRFEGVPFYVRAGKKMPTERIEISIVFIQTCHLLFKEYGCPEIGNVLTFKIQPDEGIGMRVITKQPGSKVALGSVDMKFTYKEAFSVGMIDAYEKLLMDIFSGDQMLFNRSDELESSWKLISNILTGWENDRSPIPSYEPGTWGPKEANALLEKDGRKWL